MATQLSAVSFVSVPAFVARAEGGGLRWLAFEFGLPLGIGAVLVLLVPVFTDRWPISIYHYLERRVGSSTRRLVSGLFLISRGLATGVIVLTGGLVVATALDVNLAAAIVLVALLTLAYDLIGGMRVVILSDVLQMGIILVGLLACGGVAVSMVGWESALGSLSPERYRILLWSDYGLRGGTDYGVWPMFFGGMFLYAAYYGCDQSQMQRELSTQDVSELRGSLLFNALGRFPVVLTYCLVGVAVGAVVSVHGHAAEMATELGMGTDEFTQLLEQDPDRMLPAFILTYLPPGVVGLLFAGLIAALMSSLDSAVNSLSAVTVQDQLDHFFPELKQRIGELTLSRMTTCFWALFALTVALIFGYAGDTTRQTVVELINQVGSVMLGPILGAFVLAVLREDPDPFSVNCAVILGLGVSVSLWLLTWQTSFHLSWLWWIPSSTLSVFALGFLIPAIARKPDRFRPDNPIRRAWPDQRNWLVLLMGWTMVLLGICAGLQWYLIGG